VEGLIAYTPGVGFDTPWAHLKWKRAEWLTPVLEVKQY
jgi:hypothetical protein